jgi:hypothetical protein
MDEENRVEALLRKWRAEHPIGRVWRRENGEEDLAFFDKLRMAFRNTPNPKERESLVKVEAAIRDTRYKLKPDLLERLAAVVDRMLERLAGFILKALKVEDSNDFQLGMSPRWVPRGLSAIDRQEKEAQIAGLSKDLRMHGLSGRISDHALTLLYHGADSFSLTQKIGSDEDRAVVNTQVERSSLTGKYYAVGYDLVAYRGLTPTRDAIGNIDVQDLDRRMASIDWGVNYSNAGIGNSPRANGNVIMSQAVNGVFHDLGSLLESNDPVARKIHNQLAVKYFANTPNSNLVENFEEIKKDYEHRVHVDLTLGSLFPLIPVEALTLLNGGAITQSSDPGGLGPYWLSLVSERDAKSYHEIRPIEGSEKFSLHAGLAEAHVVGFPSFISEDMAIAALAKGKTIKAAISENGEVVERLIYANPEKGKVSVDWIRTEEEGLFYRDDRLASTVDRYRGQQRGLQSELLSETVDRDAGEITQVAKQSDLFGSEKQQLPSDRSNLASLERQLLEIGARPGIAAEILEKIKASGENEVSIPHNFERDGDTINTQIRFKRDTDLEWVRLHGFDVHVNFGNGDQAVSQRFYYNSEDTANSFSLSEAYNMAKGNPVARVVIDAQGQQKEVWRQLSLDEPLTPRGNHVVTNTDFDLKSAMTNYPKRVELEKALGRNISIESLLDQARMGDRPRFNLNGSDDIFVLRVLPGERRIEIVRSPDGRGNSQSNEQADKRVRRREGKKDDAEPVHQSYQVGRH